MPKDRTRTGSPLLFYGCFRVSGITHRDRVGSRELWITRSSTVTRFQKGLLLLSRIVWRRVASQQEHEMLAAGNGPI